MKANRAIILAAGEGRRLLPFTSTNPKCFAEVSGTTILENALNRFAEHGVDRVSIAVGHLKENIVRRIGARYRGMMIEYVVNSEYNATNSMFSLLLSLKENEGPVWVLEGDVFFESGILDLPPRGHFSWFADSSTRHLDGAYLKGDSGGQVVSLEIIRDLKLLSPGHHKSIGLLHLTAEGVRTIVPWLEKGVAEGKSNIYYDLIMSEHLREYRIDLVDVIGFRWFEIDTNEDLEMAQKMFPL
jgi:choline kinase